MFSTPVSQYIKEILEIVVPLLWCASRNIFNVAEESFPPEKPITQCFEECILMASDVRSMASRIISSIKFNQPLLDVRLIL